MAQVPQVGYMPHIGQVQYMPQMPHMAQMQPRQPMPHMATMQPRAVAPIPQMSQVQPLTEISRLMLEEHPFLEKYTTHYVTKPIRILIDDMIKIHGYTKNDKVVIDYYNAIFGDQQTYASASSDSGIGGSNVSLDELIERAKSLTNIYRNYTGLERFYGGRAKTVSYELTRIENEIHYQRELDKAGGKSKSACDVIQKKEITVPSTDNTSNVATDRRSKIRTRREAAFQAKDSDSSDLNVRDTKTQKKPYSHSKAKESIATRIAREGKNSDKSSSKQKQKIEKSVCSAIEGKADICGKNIEPEVEKSADVQKLTDEGSKDFDKQHEDVVVEIAQDIECIDVEKSVKSAFRFWKIAEDAMLKTKKEQKSVRPKETIPKEDTEAPSHCQSLDVSGQEECCSIPKIKEPDEISTFTTSSNDSKKGFIWSGEQGIREDIEQFDDVESQSEEFVSAIKQTFQRRQDVITESDSSVLSPGGIGGETMTDDECLGAVGGEMLMRQQMSEEQNYTTETIDIQKPIGTPKMSFKK